MSDNEDGPKRRPTVHQIGEDLSALSLDELDERLQQLGAEIDRIRAAHAAKTASRHAASSFFKA